MKHLCKRLLALLLVLGMSLSLTTTAAAEGAGEGYTVEVTADKENPAAGDMVSLTARVTCNGEEITDLEAEGLYLWWWTDVWAEGHGDGLTDAAYSNYDNNSGRSLTADVTLPSVGTYYIAAQLQDETGADVWKEFLAFTTTEDETVQNAAINVTKIPNLANDFIMGMDISSVVSELNSGVTYQDFDGNVIDNVSDFCQFLAQCGITHVRVRVWNDPYDADRNGYGGGNNDVPAAVEIAKGCAAAGIKMLIDFHYSDFWADPGKQDAPKAWADYTIGQKETAMYDFTLDALQKIAAVGADIDMVQVGNETTGGICGVYNAADMCTLFSAGAAAVREFNPETKVVIHVTNPEKATMTKWAETLDNNKVDYDILATSYYPYWHGTLDNLKSQMQTVRETYNKDVMVAETSYAYSLEDSDGHGNTVCKGSNDSVTAYSFTPQGQADCLRDIMAAVNEAGGLGVFYWESAWITVGDTTGLEGEAYKEQVAANKVLWETYGSGWASSYAAEYDPDDAGVWYGGSAVDNQAMFYPDGSPVASILVWQYVKTGAETNVVRVESIEACTETIEVGGTYSLPETVKVTYNKGTAEEAVTWVESEAAAIRADQAGTYVVHGAVTFSYEVNDGEYAGKTAAPVTYTLTVKEANLITDKADAGFESGENFTVEGEGVKAIPSTEDVLDGAGTLHWYNPTATVSTITYDVPLALAPGWYTFEAVAMGYAGDTVTLSILDTERNVLFTGEPSVMAGWTTVVSECRTPSVTFGLERAMTVKLQVTLGISDGGWGSVDCLYLHHHGRLAVTGNGDGTDSIDCIECGRHLYDQKCREEIVKVADAAGEEGAFVLYRCVLCGTERKETVSAEITGFSAEVKLEKGGTSALEAVCNVAPELEGVTYKSSYSSGNEAVARVDQNGKVTAVGAGRAEITYTVTGTVVIDGETHTFVVARKTVMIVVSEKAQNSGSKPSSGSSQGSGNTKSDSSTAAAGAPTGDTSNPVFYMVTVAICLAAIAVWTEKRRKDERKNG